MPSSSSPAKKIRLTSSTDLSAAIPQVNAGFPITSQAPGSSVYPTVSDLSEPDLGYQQVSLPFKTGFSLSLQLNQSFDTGLPDSVVEAQTQLSNQPHSRYTLPTLSFSHSPFISSYPAAGTSMDSHMPTTLPEQFAGEQSTREKVLPEEPSVKSGSLQAHVPSATSVSDKLPDASGTSRAASEHLIPTSDITAALEEISRLKQENQLLHKRLSVYNASLLQASEEKADMDTREQGVSTVICCFSFS